MEVYKLIISVIKNISISSILDILVVAFIFYKSYMLMKETRAIQLLKGIIFIFVLIPISQLLNLTVLNWILNKDNNNWCFNYCYHLSTGDKKSLRAYWKNSFC